MNGDTERGERINLSDSRFDCILVEVAEGSKLIRRYAKKITKLFEREFLGKLVTETRPPRDRLIEGERVLGREGEHHRKLELAEYGRLGEELHKSPVEGVGED